MLWLILLVILLGAIYFYNRYFKYWKRRGVKQGVPVPFLGDTYKNVIKGVPFCNLLMHLYDRFPDARYSGVYQFYFPALMIQDPELIKQMAVKDYEHFLNHSTFIPEDSDTLWNKNLFSLKDQKWKEMRATLSPSFTGSKMRMMFVVMHECAKKFVSFLAEEPGEILEMDLKDSFTRYTNDMIATTAFGIQCDSLRDRENEFFIRGRQATDFTGFWKNIKFLVVMLMPGASKIFKNSFFGKETSAFFRKVIRETIEYRDKNNIERPDMLNLLRHARKGTINEEETERTAENHFAAVEEHIIYKHKGKLELSLEDITSQALIFLFAGFETVSLAMCFMCYELAVNPDIQEKLIAELDEFREKNNTLTYESLSKLTYLDMVLSETLRKWPPNLVLDRVCSKPYTIEPLKADEEPVHLTTADAIWLPVWGLHHDPKFWKNPNKFDPERFSPENKEKIVPYTYLPFGVGPRNCIGSRFAITEVKALIYELLEQFEVVPVEKSCIPFVPNQRTFNLTSANGFWFGLKKRKLTEL